MLDSATWKLIDETILHVYESRDDVALRTHFLDDCAAIIPHRISFFDLASYSQGRKTFFNPVSTTMGKEELISYYERLIEVDYTSWVQNQPGCRPVYRDSDYISKQALRQSTLYRDWLEPMGVMYGCCLIVSHGGIDYGTATFGRQETQGDFTNRDVEVLRVLSRHLGLRFSQLFPQGIAYRPHNKVSDATSHDFGLTKREEEIVRMLCQGIPNTQIAQTLFIAPSTLSRHTANIYRKVGVSSRVELMNVLSRT